ncbi:uncharacterized protein LOC134184874 [Corticium candelabrum]|uniref:uncharacterized protein LOC134184874 n=1 Tax=Corticium candelabrum TaxID=121492 RepID=UPI002E374F10|nr:uncharacterized protein LOC134184874 [Corticium candelabrum]
MKSGRKRLLSKRARGVTSCLQSKRVTCYCAISRGKKVVSRSTRSRHVTEFGVMEHIDVEQQSLDQTSQAQPDTAQVHDMLPEHLENLQSTVNKDYEDHSQHSLVDQNASSDAEFEMNSQSMSRLETSETSETSDDETSSRRDDSFINDQGIFSYDEGSSDQTEKLSVDDTIDLAAAHVHTKPSTAKVIPDELDMENAVRDAIGGELEAVSSCESTEDRQRDSDLQQSLSQWFAVLLLKLQLKYHVGNMVMIFFMKIIVVLLAVVTHPLQHRFPTTMQKLLACSRISKHPKSAVTYVVRPGCSHLYIFDDCKMVKPLDCCEQHCQQRIRRKVCNEPLLYKKNLSFGNFKWVPFKTFCYYPPSELLKLSLRDSSLWIC